jgi:hypothetical protein
MSNSRMFRTVAKSDSEFKLVRTNQIPSIDEC